MLRVVTTRRLMVLLLLWYFFGPLMGLGYDLDEQLPMVKGYHLFAVAVPPNGIYFRDTDLARTHEMCHIRRMKEAGTVRFVMMYFLSYIRGSGFACQEERRCGWKGPHPACEPAKGVTCESIFGSFVCDMVRGVHD